MGLAHCSLHPVDGVLCNAGSGCQLALTPSATESVLADNGCEVEFHDPILGAMAGRSRIRNPTKLQFEGSRLRRDDALATFEARTGRDPRDFDLKILVADVRDELAQPLQQISGRVGRSPNNPGLNSAVTALVDAVGAADGASLLLLYGVRSPDGTLWMHNVHDVKNSHQCLRRQLSKAARRGRARAA